jgi:hypothetical protein
MTIRYMKMAWADIVAPASSDVMESMSKFLRIAAAAIRAVDSTVTAEALEEIATIDDFRPLDQQLAQLYRNSGMRASEPGEATAATASPSTETGTQSSPS